MVRRLTRKRRDQEEDDEHIPTHILKIGTSPGVWTRVGVAWKSETTDGVPYFSLRLNPGVILDWHDFSGECALHLYPNDKKKDARRRR